MAFLSREPREYWLKSRFSKNEVANSGRKVFGGVAGLLPEAWGSLLLVSGCLLLKWLVLLFLYRRKIFLRV